MPHSGGGGSHGGGSHGGSHGRSHSSAPRMSRRPFHNSTRYMYYDRYGSPRYIYSTVAPQPQSKFALIFSLAFMIPFVIVSVFLVSMILSMVGPPKKLKPLPEYGNVHIQDNALVFNDEEEIEPSLKSFEDLTGICPYIITVYDSDWQGKYTSLENYAYTLYVNKFPDEQHFLIVYSYPDTDYISESDFIDWSWETMVGDDTDNILNGPALSQFNDDLRKYLTMDSVTTDNAFIKTFNDSKDYMMSGNPTNPNALFMIFFAVIWILATASGIITTIKGYIISQREYIVAPQEEQNMVDIM